MERNVIAERWALVININATEHSRLKSRARSRTFDSNSVSLDIKLKAPTHSSRAFFLSICKVLAELRVRSRFKPRRRIRKDMNVYWNMVKCSDASARYYVYGTISQCSIFEFNGLNCNGYCIDVVSIFVFRASGAHSGGRWMATHIWVTENFFIWIVCECDRACRTKCKNIDEKPKHMWVFCPRNRLFANQVRWKASNFFKNIAYHPKIPK